MNDQENKGLRLLEVDKKNKNSWNNRDSLVNILTIVGSSQESRHFSGVRFKMIFP